MSKNISYDALPNETAERATDKTNETFVHVVPDAHESSSNNTFNTILALCSFTAMLWFFDSVRGQFGSEIIWTIKNIAEFVAALLAAVGTMFFGTKALQVGMLIHITKDRHCIYTMAFFLQKFFT